MLEPRKKGNTIGRLKGPISYIDLRTIENITYPTLREACEASGFLADDTEYVKAIKEAKEWGSGNFLRRLFVIVLMSNSINKPEDVWKKTSE